MSEPPSVQARLELKSKVKPSRDSDASASIAELLTGGDWFARGSISD